MANNSKNGIEAVNQCIFQSDNIRKANTISVPSPKAAQSPNMKGTGCTILGQGKPAEFSQIDQNIIPIFPVRFAISGDALLDLRDGKPVPPIPTSLHDMTDHQLLRIRRGYIFIIDDQNRWHIFWYETNWKDNNAVTRVARSADSNEKKAKRLQGRAPYSFNKVKWQDKVYSRGPWDLDLEDRIYPFAFVRNDVSTCWIAYSEERWPSFIFERLEVDIALREKLMTKLDTKSRNGKHCAPLEELGKYAHNFKNKNIDYVNYDSYQVENVFRYTSIADESIKFVTQYAAAGKGVLATIYDPTANHLDINKLISSQEYIAQKFADEYKYPITIGNLIRQLQTEKDDYKYLEDSADEKLKGSYSGSDHTVYSPQREKERREQYKLDKANDHNRQRREQTWLEKWMKEDALHTDFDREFGKFEDVFKRHDEISKNLEKALITITEWDGIGSLHYFGNTIKDIKKLEINSFDSSEIVKYISVYYLSSLKQLKDTLIGSEFIKNLLSKLYDSKDEQKTESNKIAIDYKKIRGQLEYFKIAMSYIKEQSYVWALENNNQTSSNDRLSISIGGNFKVVLSAIYTEIGHVLSYRFFRHNSAQERYDVLDWMIHNTTSSVSVGSENLLNTMRNYFQDTALEGGSQSHKARVSTSGSLIIKSGMSGEQRTQLPHKIAEVKNYYAKIDLSLDNESIDNFTTNANYSIAQNGVGLFLCSLTLMANMQNYNAANRSKTQAGRISSDPRVVMAHAFSEGIGTAYGLKLDLAAKTATRTEMTASAAQRFFSSSQAKKVLGSKLDEFAAATADDIAQYSGQLNRGVGYVVGQNMIRGISVVGVLLSLGQAWESIKNEDKTALTGHSLVAIANVALMFSSLLGPVGFAVAIGVLVIGTVMSFMGYDDIEKWIKDSFWGISDEYWSIERQKIPTLIKLSTRGLLNNIDNPYVCTEEDLLLNEKIQGTFEREVRWYYDLSVQLELKVLSDHIIEVNCGSIMFEKDTSSISYDVYGFVTQKLPSTGVLRDIEYGKKLKEVDAVLLDRKITYVEKGVAKISFTIDEDAARLLKSEGELLEYEVEVTALQLHGNELSKKIRFTIKI
ncbi:toxin VasX [Neptunomonas sp.]|uniref:toxin VasX n=2 Tax=Oceanospirillaceae TaxID=135620 RepID=UPI0035134149